MADTNESGTCHLHRVTPRIVYSRRYNIGVYGLERLHPFDSRKYGRAWRLLRRRLGRQLRSHWLRPTGPITRHDLLRVHTAAYLNQLRNPRVLAKALEVPLVARLPGWIVDWHILRAMRWATTGTIEGALATMTHRLVINLGGGYHHAKPNAGEGFCIYADAALAIDSMRRQRVLGKDDRIVHVDLDVHQGNGVCHCFAEDRAMFLFDMYNPSIYPAYDRVALDRLDCAIPLPPKSTGDEYLRLLSRRLPAFLDSAARSRPITFAIYNAGTDIYQDDLLGGLQVSHQAIVDRDWFVISELLKRGVPTLMLLSGGYHRHNYKIIADSLINILARTEEKYGRETGC
jgi:histone deacetylase 11